MTNKVMKIIIKNLANAPQIAAKKTLEELSGQDKEEAIRIFKALKISVSDDEDDN